MARTTTEGTAGLEYLNELSDYQVADGEPDIRGWSVETASGDRVGRVTDLLIDTERMKARYIEVRLDGDARPAGDDCTLVPIGAAQVRRSPDRVIVDVDRAEFARLPRQAGQQLPSREYESSVIACYSRKSDRSPAQATAGAGDDDQIYRSLHFSESGLRVDRPESSSEKPYLTRRRDSEKPG